ncbi:MAG: CoA transferase [Chloroflexi bacterium]|nr:CoA transferase [Chloroflexota bacterium]
MTSVPTRPVTSGILGGLRVLDLGDQVSGPFCAKLLADYGADVIKIEPPRLGDSARRAGPFAGDDPHPEKSIPFLYINTNKRGVTLDITVASGRRLFEGLVAKADVLVENHAPSDASARALDYATLAKINPGLVVTSITPFGQTGPYRDMEATDIVTTALSGLMYHSGDSDKEPLRNGLDQSLYVAGINGAVATLAAVFQRMTTGRGQHADVSVAECLSSHLVQPVPYYNYMGAIKGRRPIRGSAFEELMPARDGYVIPSVQGSQPWSTVAGLIGVDELQDEKFTTGAGRIEHGEELKDLLTQGLAQWDRKPLFQASGERRLVFGMAQDAGDLYHCPHLRERGFYVEVEHPEAGTVDYPGLGPRLSDMEYQVTRPAPLLGQHNQEIFCGEMGYSKEDLVRLREMGAI